MELFLISIVIYIIFLIKIYLLGFFSYALYVKQWGKRYPKSIIEWVFISFGVGISLFIGISYFFIVVWQFNNFSGNYLFIFLIVIEILYLAYLHGTFSKDINCIKNDVKIYINSKKTWLKNNISSILLITLIFICYSYYYHIKFDCIIWSSISHPSLDPYIWQGQVIHLLEIKNVDYNFNGAYPQGYVIFLTGMILPFSNSMQILQIHYFLKNLPSLLFYNLIFFFILFLWKIIPKKQKKFAIILGPCLLMIQIFYMYRTILTIPTPVISMLSIILFYYLSQKDLPIFLQGLCLATMVIIHPLNGAYYCIIYGIFIIGTTIIQNIKKRFNHKRNHTVDSSNYKNNIFQDLGLTFKKYLSVISILIIFLSIFIIDLTLKYGNTWISAYFYYFRQELHIQNINFVDYFQFLLNSLRLTNNQINTNLISSYQNTSVSEFIHYTGRSFFYFFLITIFWPNTKKRNLGTYGEISSLKSLLKLISISCFLIFLLKLINISFISKFVETEFYYIFENRTFEIFAIPMTILVIVWFSEVFEVFRSFIHRIIYKSLQKIKANGDKFVNFKRKALKMITPISMSLLIIWAFQIQYTTIQLIRFYVPSNYNEIIFEFREFQNENNNLSNEMPFLFYNQTNYRVSKAISSHFFWDHNITNIDFNKSTTEMNTFLNNYSSVEIFVIITEYDENFEAYQNSEELFLSVLFQNSNILICKYQ